MIDHLTLSCIEIEGLPFIRSDASDVSFWNVEASGHDQIDIEAGEAFAELALDAAKRFGMPQLLATIMRDMIRAGKFTGVEAGFCGTLASVARAGSMN